jgi:hypothetical protein
MFCHGMLHSIPKVALSPRRDTDAMVRIELSVNRTRFANYLPAKLRSANSTARTMILGKYFSM